MKLREKIKDAKVRLFGNRMIAGSSLAIACMAPIVRFSQDNPFPYLIRTELESPKAPTPLNWTDLLLSLGIFTGMTALGEIASKKRGSTYEIYKRTKEDIAAKCYLDERLVEGVIKRSANERHAGYCQQQGAYLAAREAGQEKVFHEARKKYSNVCLPFI